MNRPANTLRGEASFNVAEQEFVLRPSFENLIAAEEELGSLFALVERASAGSLTLAEITGLLWHCLPFENRPARENVGAAVLEMGLVNAAKPVRVLLAQALQGRA